MSRTSLSALQRVQVLEVGNVEGAGITVVQVRITSTGLRTNEEKHPKKKRRGYESDQHFVSLHSSV